MQNLSGSVPTGLRFPTGNAIPIAYGKTIASTEQHNEVTEEVAVEDAGSQLNAESLDGPDGG